MAANASPARPLVLITGVSGYIASQCLVAAVAGGYAVRGTVRSKTSAKAMRVMEIATGAVTAYVGDVVAVDEVFELVEADLMHSDGWDAAVAGVAYVLHTASPFPVVMPRDENELIRPAVAGVEHILAAAAKEPSIIRVVVTSSIAAIGAGHAKIAGVEAEYSEADWSNTADDSPIDAYAKSKTLAERAAWAFMDEHAPGFDLVALCPGYVIGPTLLNYPTTSSTLPIKLLTRAMPVLPRLSFGCVDVRDVAAAHMAALTAPDASGKRYILVERAVWVSEFAQHLASEFDSRGFNVPTKTAPYAVLWLASWFDSAVATILPSIGTRSHFTNTAATRDLGITFRDSMASMISFGYSLIANGLVQPKRMPPAGVDLIPSEALAEVQPFPIPSLGE
ncbi:nucleoside-diphosphate-sugar epimerase [Thecamonas trahens ATCC 50062]|uniref:Nucleoside-diphosphate-sugar epimerase n=1 Tax=Thecamonas trahens ATCC 50062 TaxID=461836 RepID=A0A0L0DRK9_THETB|nr:nucleoside-diphosphate-sugar epimerase [Thecamonas trahens ATCC 50062]KNC54969.1 nucleoside-diphosphate-sugar epimerase [Thecamonas trahens ATCC 50062]|eukprot:XP_013753416.1 nucleoside-diphosphate-sugar epimerase [Thecamonas trahens ATCC 50062]